MDSYAEIKNEYINILTSILAPLIYQGFQSIFETAKVYKQKNDIKIDELRIFQDLLRNCIPNWSSSIIEQEVRRIKVMSKHGDTLEYLLKAVIKAFLHLHTMKKDLSKAKYVSSAIYENASFTHFIHKTYIQSAREIFNNPFLMNSSAPLREFKENQREVINIIKMSIRLTIKDMLPLDKVILEFLEDERETEENLFLQQKDDKENYAIQKYEGKGVKVNDDNLLYANPKIEPDSIQKGGFKNVLNTKKEYDLLNTEKGNIAEQIFSSFKIQENRPNLIDEIDLKSVTEPHFSPTLKVGHTISNFLKDVPVGHESEIKQSVIEDFIDVYDNSKR